MTFSKRTLSKTKYNSKYSVIVAEEWEKKEGGLGRVAWKTRSLCDPTQPFFFQSAAPIGPLFYQTWNCFSSRIPYHYSTGWIFSLPRKKILRSLNQSLDPPIKNFWIRPSSSILCHRGLTSSKCKGAMQQNTPR